MSHCVRPYVLTLFSSALLMAVFVTPCAAQCDPSGGDPVFIQIDRRAEPPDTNVEMRPDAVTVADGRLPFRMNVSLEQESEKVRHHMAAILRKAVVLRKEDLGEVLD